MAPTADLTRDELTARMVLTMIVEPNDPITGRVLSRVGAVATLSLIDGDSPVPGMNREDARTWRDRLIPTRHTAAVATRLKTAEQTGLGVLAPGDTDWLASVNDLGDRAPYALWTRGTAPLLARPFTDRVTLAGARAATAYGEHVAGSISSDLASHGRIIVAGGAYGIEGAAHRAAIAVGGETIAVLAGGVDRPYPAGHRELLDRVGDVGLLLSELPPGATPTRHRFLARGRIMAALSGASVIVEAAARSGSLNLAAEARALGRRVGAVPGPITSVTSAGPHRLLREGKAQIVTESADVTRMLKQGAAPNQRLDRTSLSSEFSYRYEHIATFPDRSL
ncbi:DNA-processing protein DprA [Calidifontibacter sp. DB0510]|uniref:DNA-processing protein DprA n=1 Tax=Metallococcus carri TaxID=1656884 RepID=A0A967AZ80_9MICO|nr:DNA-processing protein DprA [Metallococcus carri]NHN54340.1 DNA-processing protein DprA [Metallococcus carri]NOP36820.1 DNA-protecting protein DprA [Calidifontibacter sp. DB2511S]